MAAECCSSCEYQRTVGYPSTSWASCLAILPVLRLAVLFVYVTHVYWFWRWRCGREVGNWPFTILLENAERHVQKGWQWVIMPPPRRGGGALSGHRRPSVCLMSRTSALTRKPKGLGRRNFTQGYPRSYATPTPTSRSKVKVTGRGHYCGGHLAAQLVSLWITSLSLSPKFGLSHKVKSFGLCESISDWLSRYFEQLIC